MTGSLTFDVDADGIGLLVLDVPGQPVNTLRRELAVEFDVLIDRMEADPALRALVLVSGKPGGFIAGADLKPVLELDSPQEGTALSRLMQDVTLRIAALPCVSVAAIHGDCLGGGLELALAFDARIASEDVHTRLGLPEVQLGLLPGGGGTQRLPRLVGLSAALDLLLTGRRLDAQRALRVGLVDVLAPPEALRSQALTMARGLAEQGHAARRVLRRPSGPRLGRVALAHWFAARNPLGRQLVFSRALKDVRRRTRGQYPAPERILDVVRTGLTSGLHAGLEAEARAFGELCMTPQSRALVNLFFDATELKKDPGVDAAAGVSPRPVEHVAIVGAGFMGTGIARVSVLEAGTRVTLIDQDPALARAARERLARVLDDRVRRQRMSAAEHDEVMSRIHVGEGLAAAGVADLVIEAVYEDLALKGEVLREIERVCGEQTVFASNTSAITIARIGAPASRPGRVVGMHYFSPVERMPLLEVVASARTAPETVATCVAFGRRQGKTVVVVNDGPGFYTTRILAPYLNEAAWLLSEGAAVETVDEALLAFGFAVGPFALLDEVGIDVAEKVASTLRHALGERMRPPDAMAGLAGDGRQGRKNGRGFYRYDRPGGRRLEADASVQRVLGLRTAPRTVDGLAERCCLLMVNEAVRCLEEGVLRRALDGDVAAVFGLGFPAFLGGPFRYADRLGAGELVTRLEALARHHGERFEPASRLRELASTGGRFRSP